MSIVLFDGTCELCSGFARFTKRHDKRGRFNLVPLQSAEAARILNDFGLARNLETFVLVEEGVAYTHSTATLRYLKGLGGGWGLLYFFIIIPKSVRDAVYRWVAKHRHSLTR